MKILFKGFQLGRFRKMHQTDVNVTKITVRLAQKYSCKSFGSYGLLRALDEICMYERRIYLGISPKAKEFTRFSTFYSTI